METNKTPYIDIQAQGTLWWSIWIFLSVIGLSYIALWGFFNQSIQAGFITIIFGFLLLISLIVLLLVMTLKTVKSGKEFDINTSWRRPSLSFIIFFIIQAGIIKYNNIGGNLSFVTLQKNVLFSLFSTQVPLIADFLINVIMVPVIEELFFLFAIPQIIFLLMTFIGKKWSILENKIIQIIVAILISSVTFALFHVGKSSLSFIISAMVFRAIVITLFWGDAFTNFIWFADILASGMVGLHIGNNWSIYGLTNGVLILMTSIWGWGILLIFAIMILSASDYVLDMFKIGIGGDAQ